MKGSFFFSSWFQTQDFGVSFARVDADTIDKIIAKEENIPSKLTKEQEDLLKPIFEDISEKEKYTVQIEFWRSSELIS